MIQLTTTTHGIIVPIDAYDIEINNTWLEFRAKKYLDEGDSAISISGFEGFEILGTVTNEEISFDVELYVNGKEIKECWNDFLTKCFANYINLGKYFTDKNDSYLSLLKSKGIELKQNEKLLILKTV